MLLLLISLTFGSLCSQLATAAERLDQQAVPSDATWVVSIRLADMPGREQLSVVARLLDEAIPPLKMSNLNMRDLREVMFIENGDPSRESKQRRVIQFLDSAREKQFIDAIKRDAEFKQVAAGPTWQTSNQRITEIDALTVRAFPGAVEGWLTGRLMVGLADGAVLPISPKPAAKLRVNYRSEGGRISAR
jgi:hypothetical protein